MELLAAAASSAGSVADEAEPTPAAAPSPPHQRRGAENLCSMLLECGDMSVSTEPWVDVAFHKGKGRLEAKQYAELVEDSDVLAFEMRSSLEDDATKTKVFVVREDEEVCIFAGDDGTLLGVLAMEGDGRQLPRSLGNGLVRVPWRLVRICHG